MTDLLDVEPGDFGFDFLMDRFRRIVREPVSSREAVFAVRLTRLGQADLLSDHHCILGVQVLDPVDACHRPFRSHPVAPGFLLLSEGGSSQGRSQDRQDQEPVSLPMSVCVHAIAPFLVPGNHVPEMEKSGSNCQMIRVPLGPRNWMVRAWRKAAGWPAVPADPIPGWDRRDSAGADSVTRN